MLAFAFKASGGQIGLDPVQLFILVPQRVVQVRCGFAGWMGGCRCGVRFGNRGPGHSAGGHQTGVFDQRAGCRAVCGVLDIGVLDLGVFNVAADRVGGGVRRMIGSMARGDQFLVDAGDFQVFLPQLGLPFGGAFTGDIVRVMARPAQHP